MCDGTLVSGRIGRSCAKSARRTLSPLSILFGVSSGKMWEIGTKLLEGEPMSQRRHTGTDPT